jgi:hypothetical protein
MATKKAPPDKDGRVASEAARLLEEKDTAAIAAHADNFAGGAKSAATQSARVLGEIVIIKPEALSSYVDRFVAGLRSDNKRVVATSAQALPAIAQVAPARVAKHLERLKQGFEDLSEVGQGGIVHTFANLCSASVAYQKRLEPVLKLALRGADGKILVEWTKTVLPALKGEPHANARAVVESRLPNLDRAHAQAIADFLGIKLRPRTR